MEKSISISDSFDLGKVYTGKLQRRDPAISQKKSVFALDTETWKGDIFLIADSDGRYLDRISAKSVIEFLFHKKYQGSWNFFYNLGYDAEVILKLLDDVLEIYKRTNSLLFKFEDYTLTYIPDKVLRISKGHHSVSFYDIAQFYHTSLQNAYEANIASLPELYKKMKQRRAYFSRSFYSSNRKKVRNYCITDCKLTKKLAQHWIEQFHKVFCFYPTRWISSGYLSEKVLINNKIEIPKFNTIPYQVQKLAWAVVEHGGRFEITKRGFIGKAYLYDINSAYPYAFSKIPDLQHGKWIRQKSIHKDAQLGFFKIIANIPDEKLIAPFPFKKGIRIFFPTGRFQTIVTLHELKACENENFYKILDSYQFIPESKNYPYKKFVASLFEKRAELKKNGNPMHLPIKIILNSIYGKTGQKQNGIGNLFNPVMFVTITGMIRALLYRFAMENNLEKSVVAFATDSILTTKKLRVNSKRLGNFSFEKEALDCYILQNGYYFMNGKWKNRGITSMRGKTLRHLDTFQKDGKLFLKLQELRNTRLRSGILLGKISDIGDLKPKTRQIDPNADKKRFWLGTLSAINHESNDSMPISLNHFTIF